MESESESATDKVRFLTASPGSVSSLSLGAPARLSVILGRAATFATGRLLKVVAFRVRSRGSTKVCVSL